MIRVDWNSSAAWLGRWMMVAAATSLSVCVVEGGLAVAAREFAGLAPRALVWQWAWEATVALALLVGLAVTVGGPRRLLGRLHRRLNWPWLAGVVLALVVVVPAMVLGQDLVAGDWISRQSWAPILRWAPVPAAVVAALLFGRLLVAATDPEVGRAASPRRRRVSLAAAAGLASAFAAVDGRIQPGLFASFHVACHLAGLAVWILLWSAVFTRRRTQHALAGIVGLAVIAGVTMISTMSMRSRAALAVHSSSAGYLLRYLTPAPRDRTVHRVLEGLSDPNRAVAPPAPPARPLAAKPAVNVVFVLVDTLRADTLPPTRQPGQMHAQDGDTPFLDQWIAGSYRFTRNYAQASMTKQSVPAMFRSIETVENPTVTGQALSTTVSELGKRSLAVVNNFFVEPRFRETSALLDGFDEVVVYEKREMDREVELALEMLTANKAAPFFAWFHFYCMHDPGFDGKMLGPADGAWTGRYRRSLQWLDGQLEQLFTGIDKLGLGENTIIVLAGDHGEGLGDNRIPNHGATVYEEEIRTPLVIHVPGTPGGLIDATVGNIDILPTLIELLGGEPQGQLRGRSLVPLLADPSYPWASDYLAANGKSVQFALVSGTDKLIVDTEANVRMRFELDSDPKEELNLYEGESEADEALLRRLVVKYPKLFAAELAEPETRELLHAVVAQQNKSASHEAILVLSRLAALDLDAALKADFGRIFDVVKSDEVRVTILSSLYAKDRRFWGSRLKKWLGKLPAGERRVAVVRALGAAGQAQFEPRFVASAIEAAQTKGQTQEVLAYLGLVNRWPDKASGDFAKTWLTLLTAVHAAPTAAMDAAMLRLIHVRTLTAIGSTKWPKRAKHRPEIIEILARDLGEADDEVVLVGTCRALAALGATEVSRSLRALETHAAIRVKQAALQAFAKIEGAAAIPDIVRWAEDPLLTVDAIDLLRSIGSADGLPYLKKVAAGHYNHLIRGRAQAAVDKIHARNKAKK